MKNKQYLILSIFLLFFFVRLSAARQDTKYRVLFIQSYTDATPWHSNLIRGVEAGLRDRGLDAEVVTEYLNANYWSYRSEKIIMNRICERARERKTQLIVTASDEAFHTLFHCGDSLPYRLPVVFFGVKYPDWKLLERLPNVCGFTSNPNFGLLLEQASHIFPQRNQVVCISDNSFLSQKGKEDFMHEWEVFLKSHPDYKVKFYNSQTDTTNKIIASTCYPRNTANKLIIAPKWSQFMSFIGRNSKAPFFSCENLALTNGAFGAYDADSYTSARKAGLKAADVLKGAKPADLGIAESSLGFMYDYKQLDFFKVNPKLVGPDGVIINEPFAEKYRLPFILFYSSVVVLLILLVVWLYRTNRRETRRRINAQTRLLIQSRLVAQRDEFDNIFHSIRDGLITYDVDFRIHFTNLSLLRMLHLSDDNTVRPYEGQPAGSIYRIYHQGKEILRPMLKRVIDEGTSVVIPENSFMQEVHSGNYFPVSGEIVPIRVNGKIIGMALSCRNISDEEMQKRFFSMAVEESSIYPWQYNLRTGMFTFPVGFLARFGFKENVTTIARKEMDLTIFPEDVEPACLLFDQALQGKKQNTRVSFRQRNGRGEYEWWEYRTSILSGLTADEPYSILGVCQSIQRYKTTEQQLMAARDKALEADKLKSAFLANMSHEIRTPLNAIVGFSDLLTDTSGFTAEEVKQFIETINKNCGLLLALINDILDLSRIESGSMDFRFDEHNLPLLMKNVYDSQRLNMPAGVELVLRLPEGGKKYVVTDSIRLQQVINNLINNAAKFTTQGTITFGYLDEEPGYTTLFVEDTGKGISKEGLEHVFERFYKVDSFTQGAGLGLSICQTIIERLHGSISVASEVDKGTRFTVRIPDSCE